MTLLNILSSFLLAEGSKISKIPEETKKIINAILMIVLVLAAIFIIVLVLLQKSAEASEISALSGSTETYLGQNLGKSPERRKKIATLVLGIVIVVLSIIYFVIQMI